MDIDILSLDRAWHNLVDAEIDAGDARDDFRAGRGDRVQAADARLRRRRVEFDAAFLASLGVAA